MPLAIDGNCTDSLCLNLTRQVNIALFAELRADEKKRNDMLFTLMTGQNGDISLEFSDGRAMS